MSYSLPVFLPSAAFACAAVLALTGCERSSVANEPAAEFAWARAALERNPQLELVASDPGSRVFTVRDRKSDRLLAVKVDELAAAPVSQLQSQAAAADQPHKQAEAAPQSEPAQPPSAAAGGTSTQPAPAEPAAPVARASGQAASGPASPGEPGGKDYTIERSDGRIRVSGPGVSIVSSGAAQPDTRRSAPGQSSAEPIICEGPRMIHLDNRSIYVDGNAITARGGCELFITNSRIDASGTGIVVHDAAVHVSNSHIAGADASIDAGDRARLYVRGSTFEGVPRRTELALVQDQGGNRWQ